MTIILCQVVVGPDVTIPQGLQLMSEPQKDEFDSDLSFGDDERPEEDKKEAQVDEGNNSSII